MAKYEVFIPAQELVGFDMTFRVDADNWMAALKIGMEKTGGAGPGANILCDIKDDNSIHVTDPGSGKVFRIRELSEAEAAGAMIAPAPEAPPADELGSAPALAMDEDEPGTEPGAPMAPEEITAPGGGTLPAMPAATQPAAPARAPAPPTEPAAPSRSAAP
ncbi:MAG: hypothetical protein P1V51_22855, partial [Deltaproteobacteria bacterium]|nr:hypothetical protein [Deltaproteobacteria bacterium]